MCYDVETPDFCRCEVVTARKEHRCDECRRIIGRGETYERFFGVMYGDPYTAKTCSGCLDIRDEVLRHERAMGCEWNQSLPPIGELLSAWREIEHENNRAMVA